jgi:predicted acylesterase/phospholipase RssA
MDRLHAKHGLASAALPSVLPPVELNLETHTVKLVDGGICDNIPVDPAARLGARDILIFDASGRKWWCDVYNEPYYSKSSWEVLSKTSTFCHCPPRLTEFRNTIGLGTILKETVGKSTKSFIQALGPTWPIFRLLKHSMGETLAYEVMSYAALHHDYIDALLEQGYNDAKEIIAKQELHFNGFSDDHGIAA